MLLVRDITVDWNSISLGISGLRQRKRLFNYWNACELCIKPLPRVEFIQLLAPYVRTM
jgi:hypothetical protein